MHIIGSYVVLDFVFLEIPIISSRLGYIQASISRSLALWAYFACNFFLDCSCSCFNAWFAYKRNKRNKINSIIDIFK